MPSALAILATTWLIYAYARIWTSRLASFRAAAAFATFGQVLQLGRFGESEAVFTLFVAASMLVWHGGYLRAWPPALAWSLGYSLAAFGALTKGLQAPIYFAAACSVYLLWRRDWQWLFGFGHATGLACFVLIVGSWLIPFSAACPNVVDDIWTGLAQDRFVLAGLTSHLLSFPLETLGCLLPWSVLLLLLAKKDVRNAILLNRPQVRFLLVALAVTYPSLWIAAGARGRYYMPLYPMAAILVGLVIEHCASGAASVADRLAWRRYLQAIAAIVVIGGLSLAVSALLPWKALEVVRLPLALLPPWALVVAVTVGAHLLQCSRSNDAPRPQLAVCAVACFLGFAYVGPVLNVRVRSGNDISQTVVDVRRQLPDPSHLVSFDRIYHRFTYEYGLPIGQIPWPISAGDLPPEVTYFCFDRRPDDTQQARTAGDGRYSWLTPGELPFAWEKIAEIPCDPVRRPAAHRSIIIGRVRRTTELADKGTAPK